jgi:hypothetical protein
MKYNLLLEKHACISYGVKRSVDENVNVSGQKSRDSL